MEHLVEATRAAVTQRNWYAGLALALTLPDICARVADAKAGTPQGLKSSKRYIAWCDRYLAPKYTSWNGNDGTEHRYLGGADVYALRCAVLHEGTDSIISQRAREALTRFAFTDSPRAHCNQFGSVLQLDVTTFCRDVCEAVVGWRHDTRLNPALQERVSKLMRLGVNELAI